MNRYSKTSFAGAGAITVNIGRVTVAVVTVVPPPGGGFRTPTEFVLPKFAMKLAARIRLAYRIRHRAAAPL